MNTDFVRNMGDSKNSMYMNNYYVNQFEIGSQVDKFDREVYQPFKKAIAAAEEAKRKAEEEAKKPKAEEHHLKAPVVSNIEGLAVNTQPAEGIEGLGVAIKTIVKTVVGG